MTMSSLTTFFRQGEKSDRSVAICNERTILFSEFERDVKSLTKYFTKRRERQWGVYCDDTYRFAVTLVALLYSGKQAVLLPNIQEGFVTAIQSEIDAIASDSQEHVLPLELLDVTSIPGSDAKLCDLPELDIAPLEVALFTSGTTGQPQRIVKRLSQLETEVAAFEQQWGGSIEGSTFIATVSHQHIYGLLFRVLWPLLNGRCFDSRTYQFPEALLQQILSLDKVTLISSPAHLKRIPELVDLSLAQEKIALVFSSGGPLPIESAVSVFEALKVGVVEVFGSTETGGIAYRSQTQLEQSFPWVPFSVVETKIREEDSRLLIKSPFEGSKEWFEMGDQAEQVGDQGFILLGRADKIVKIEEKRLSLLEVEQKLRGSEWVEDVAATVIQSKRSNVAVAIVLSNSGQGLLEQIGLLAMKQKLTQHLSAYFEAVVLPKRWRFLEALPYNSQGKLPQSELKALFETSVEKGLEPEVTEPEIKVVKRTDNTLELELHVPGNLSYFDGHFPGRPILPGVVQLDWAALYGKRFFSINDRFKDMEAVKFHEFINPEDTIKLNLAYDEAKRKLQFSFESVKGKHSSGRLVCE